MEQLILHLIGDYITQTDWMAKNKRTSAFAATLHGTIYSLPFLLVNSSLLALFVIYSTHVLIDHFGAARYVVFVKNFITNPSLNWKDCSATGYHKDDPAYLTVWLLIIADNTLHLAINFLSLKYL